MLLVHKNNMHSYYLTTPIYYINGKPSIGHAYTTIAADILARYHRLSGKQVFFLMGTDENSQKNIEAAEALGREDVQVYLDEMAQVWKKTWEKLGITHDRFVRTTEQDHYLAVEKFWKAVQEKGDIYQGEYSGLYCKGCEAFITEADLQDSLCPHHKKAPEKIVEKNYFFRLTKYRDELLAYIASHPEFIMPSSRRNEIISYIEKFMTDVSISRASMKWGIPVPGDEEQRIYVWFDALINYLTGIGYGKDEKKFEQFWPADVHLVGKDIIKFHCALWPAMLLSAGLPLPKHIFAHGFFTIDGEKMSKSLGNVVDPIEVVESYGNDVLRYFLMREIRFGEDGDYSFARMEERYQGELANELGNLVSRVCAMTGKYLEGTVPEKVDYQAFSEFIEQYHSSIQVFEFDRALDAIWMIVRQANQFVEQQKPWVLAKEERTEELASTLYILLESLRLLAYLLLPFMPETAEKILEQLGISSTQKTSQPFFDLLVWGKLEPGTKLNPGTVLFPRRESRES